MAGGHSRCAQWISARGYLTTTPPVCRCTAQLQRMLVMAPYIPQSNPASFIIDKCLLGSCVAQVDDAARGTDFHQWTDEQIKVRSISMCTGLMCVTCRELLCITENVFPQVFLDCRGEDFSVDLDRPSLVGMHGGRHADDWWLLLQARGSSQLRLSWLAGRQGAGVRGQHRPSRPAHGRRPKPQCRRQCRGLCAPSATDSRGAPFSSSCYHGTLQDQHTGLTFSTACCAGG